MHASSKPAARSEGLLAAGLMSGTSLDGVDGVLAAFDADTLRPLHVLAHVHQPFPAALEQELLALNTPGDNELHRAATAAHALTGIYADVLERLFARAGVPASGVRVVGAHGQTVRHQPAAFTDGGYTIQIINGALLAERCGVAVACDFRSADVAAGGQGAPLVPAFHAAALAEPGADVAVLNIGGIANLTLLAANGSVTGFDTGPGNLLMNLWARRIWGLAYDDAGSIAARGRVQPGLLAALLAEPYFALPPPKSTGRDLFDARWLDARLGTSAVTPEDVMATLADLTARSIADDLQRSMPGCRRVLVCGGGAHNRHLLARLAALLPSAQVTSSGDDGWAVDQVEALAFAWLGLCRLLGRPGNLPAVTGASGTRVLGALHAAGPARA